MAWFISTSFQDLVHDTDFCDSRPVLNCSLGYNFHVASQVCGRLPVLKDPLDTSHFLPDLKYCPCEEYVLKAWFDLLLLILALKLNYAISALHYASSAQIKESMTLVWIQLSLQWSREGVLIGKNCRQVSL